MLTSVEIEKLREDLRSAVREEKFEKVEEYVKKAKEVEAGILNPIINSKDRNGHSPLSIAVGKGNLEITRFLIDNGANVNIKNYYELPPIYSAVRYGTTEMIELLIDKKANISGYFPYGNDRYTLIGWAVYGNNPEKAELLLKRGAIPNGRFNLYGNS